MLAAGLSLSADRIDAFREAINGYAAEHFAADEAVPTVEVDAPGGPRGRRGSQSPHPDPEAERGAGASGGMLAGWMSDHLFGSRRAPVAGLFYSVLLVAVIGMVFALETYCPATDGYSAARIEEEVVVTETGCEVISLFPAEDLPIANRY